MTDTITAFEVKPHRFRKRPAEVEAIRWMGNNLDEILAFTGGSAFQDVTKQLIIHTLEGPVTASRGCWIIKGVWGEFYPCANGVFLETYDEVRHD